VLQAFTQKVTMEISSRMSTYWNHVLKTPEVDGCLVLQPSKRLKLLPIIQEGYNEYIQIFPNFPKVCPIEPGKYHQLNKAVMVYGFMNLPNNPVMDRFYYPNGRYKVDYLLANKDQSSTFRLSVIIEIRVRLNSDNI
jgi:hypothetical protein